MWTCSLRNGGRPVCATSTEAAAGISLGAQGTTIVPMVQLEPGREIDAASMALAQVFGYSSAIPADNSGSADPVEPYRIDMLHSGEANFAICRFPPHTPELMHATDTIDYLVILSGRVTLVLEEGEVDLGPHDFVVDRGVVHGWRNPHDEPCVAAVVNIPAHPVGMGRTV